MRRPLRRQRDTAPARRAKTLEPPRRMIADFLPPEGVPIRFEVASLSARAVAQITDILITTAVLILFMIALALADLLSGAGLVAVGALLFFAIRVPYHALAEILMNGQTFGKRLAGLRVISADGRSLSAHAVAVRNLMKEMEVFMPGTMLLASPELGRTAALILLAWITILLAVPLANPNRQRLGDILANTYVVMLPKPVLLPELAEAAPEARYTFLPHHLDHYGRYELQTLETLLRGRGRKPGSPAARRHQENMERVAETIVKRIGYEVQVPPDEAEIFLLEFYGIQRGYLENRRLFGDTREDKFHSSPGGTGAPDG